MLNATSLFVLRFIVREFYFNEKELKCEREEMMKLASDKKQQYVSIYQTDGPCLMFTGESVFIYHFGR